MEIITSATLNNILVFCEQTGPVPEVVLVKTFRDMGEDGLKRRVNSLVRGGWLKRGTLAGETAYVADVGEPLSPPVRQRAFAWLMFRAKDEGVRYEHGKLIFPKNSLPVAVAPNEPRKYPGLIVIPHGLEEPPKQPGSYVVQEEHLWKHKLSSCIRKNWKEV